MAEGHAKHHDYHLVDPSPWPIAASIAAFGSAIGAITWMRSLNGGDLWGLTGPWLFLISFTALCFVAYRWWADIVREGDQGDHTPVVQLHLRYGMIMFIASEVMFFVAWFWAYFDVALFPSGVFTPENVTTQIGMVQRDELTGGQWPPQHTDAFQGTFDPWGLPLINTLILLLSGVTVTWAHHALLENKRSQLIWALICTVGLGLMFTALPGLRVWPCGLRLLGSHLRCDLLHGDRLPRRPCGYRNDLLVRVPDPSHAWPLHPERAFRVRSRGLVLALR